MRHPSFDPESPRAGASRNSTETSSRYEVDRLQAKWAAEDAAMIRANDQQVKELADLRVRIARLERQHRTGRSRDRPGA